MSERAVVRLEEKGYLKSIRAEIRADIFKCLVDLEDEGLIPPDYRIKRFSPTSPEDYQALSYILQFLTHHGLIHTKNCLVNEVNGEIPLRAANEAQSDLGRLVLMEDGSDDDNDYA
jgi:hypothetical protein